MLKSINQLGKVLSKNDLKSIAGERAKFTHEGGCYSGDECTSSIDCGGCSCNWHPNGTYKICMGL